MIKQRQVPVIERRIRPGRIPDSARKEGGRPVRTNRHKCACAPGAHHHLRRWMVAFIAAGLCLQAGSAAPVRAAQYPPACVHIRYTGRIDFRDPARARMSSAGAYFETAFRGSACTVLLENQDLYGNHNYLAVVIDDAYRGRIRVNGSAREYAIAGGLKDTVHTLLVCKATESQIGYVDFLGLACDEIVPRPVSRKRKIEFIGNSITCGMGLDLSGVPCDSGTWFDQHNAYLAYGPRTARALDADWLLSAVSGIGVIRNWNSPGPVMPAVYGNLFLNTDSTILWPGDAWAPDMVSICLGTNDFSDGDGTYARQPPDSAAFVNAYVRFVLEIRKRYPAAEICLLTSPMNPGEKSVRLENFLRSVLQQLRNTYQDAHIRMFVFPESYTSGCDYHPDEAEHRSMAAELLPFYKNVMSRQP